MQSRTYQKVQEHPAPWLPRRRLHGIHLQPSKCALSRAQLGGVNEQGAAPTFLAAPSRAPLCSGNTRARAAEAQVVGSANGGQMQRGLNAGAVHSATRRLRTRIVGHL